MQALSTISSLYSMSLYFSATARIDFKKQAVGELHDVGFVDGVNFLAAVFLGVLEGELGDAGGGDFGDDFQAFDDAGNDFVLEAGVEIFGVFADQDDVDVFKSRFHAGEILHRAEVGVEIQSLAQGDVDAGGAAGDGGAGGAFQGDLVAADRFDGGLIDGLAFFRGFVGAGFEFFPVDLDACGFQDAADGGGDFGADAFAGDQCDLVSHGCIVLYAKPLGLSKKRFVAVAGKRTGGVQRVLRFAILVLQVTL